MSEIHEAQTIWFPGIYHGREGDYAKDVNLFSIEEVIDLVQTRAKEDGEWAIENGHVGENNENEPTMRKMMEWVSRPDNIMQCVAHILKEEREESVTVDFVCRDLANSSKWVAGSRG